MANKSEAKKRALISLLICSTAMLFRSCNGTLVKEEKKGVVVEPPTFEEIKFEDIYVPPTNTEKNEKIEIKIDDYYSTTDTIDNVKGRK